MSSEEDPGPQVKMQPYQNIDLNFWDLEQKT